MKKNSAGESGISFHAAVYGGRGYSDESLAVVLGLAERQLPVQLYPLVFQRDTHNLLSREVQDTLERLKQQSINLSRSVYYQCVPAHDFNLQVQARCRVGRTMFETDRIPDGWAERCQAMDEIWVPSEFNRQTFAASGVDEHRLRVMPAGVDTKAFRPGLEPLSLPRTRGFNFLSIFEWTQRKGPEVLLRAYLTEFKPDEDVALVLKSFARPNPDADLLPRLAYFVEREIGLTLDKAPPIILLTGFLSNADMPRLYSSADAFVLPSRGEGYGRPYMEALACERSVIATRWSGQMDFLHDENSYLIDLEGVVPTPPDVDVELYAGQRWAEPSVEHLRQLMRQVFSHREEAQRRAERGRAEMVEHWDWNMVMKRWVNEFERLLN
ncbi:MAG: glycosyltransferase [Acidobacteria bacterium]|nr:glycosyltransferase [Acidobacteriota bacterium]